MRIKGYKRVLWWVTLLCGCSDTVVEKSMVTPISLQAEVVGLESISRSTEIVKGTSMIGKRAAVYFSLEDGIYNHEPLAPTYLPFRTEVTYLEGSTTVYKDQENMLYPLTYPMTEDFVYCVGLYPAMGWEISDDCSTVSRVLDGKTDLMFAPQIRGTWQAPLSSQVYQHLLTWVNVTIRAMSEDVEKYWGKLTSVQFVNPSSKISIKLGDGVVIGDTKPEHLEMLTEQLPLKITIQDLGYVLCAPANTYKLLIKTEKQQREVTVALKHLDGSVFTGDAKGKQFILNLYFYPFNVVEAESFLIPWNEQNEDLELK